MKVIVEAVNRKMQPFVQVTIMGITFKHACDSMPEAIALAERVCKELFTVNVVR